MNAHMTVMVSSTILDLPRHRDAACDACLRAGVFPLRMEELPARDEDAVAVSLGLVDRADVYIGVFGFRYGHVPPGHERSIVELEYQQAVERAIPRLLFLMHDEHPLRVGDVETGRGADRIRALRSRVAGERVVGYFRSPEELRTLVLQSLRDLIEGLRRIPPGRPIAPRTDSTNIIPRAPAPYVVHPYTLLHTADVMGRTAELNLLTDWATRPDTRVGASAVLCVVSIGGMGKSALAWKWFNDVAPLERPDLAGSLWWSFYAPDSGFDSFVLRALAYVSGEPVEGLRHVPRSEQEERLLSALDQRPFLFVLDGLERLLIAYSRASAVQRTEDFGPLASVRKPGRQRAVMRQRRLATGSSESERSRLARRTLEAAAGAFLRRLAVLRTSRVLVSTRLLPSELETVTGAPVPGTYVHELEGLTDDDALALWRAHGVSGSRDELLRVLRTVDNYPLVIRALAGEVARFRLAPGDFDRWRATHPHFDPFGLDLVMARSHVLQVALDGLGVAEGRVLNTVAAFQMPTTFETLSALLVGRSKPLATEGALDRALTELEDRGLVSWDRTVNRYDQHPIVRGVAWRQLTRAAQTETLASLAEYFSALPPEAEVTSLDDLSAAVELYRSLLELHRFEDAFAILGDRLSQPAEQLGLWGPLVEWHAWFEEQPGATDSLSAQEQWEMSFEHAKGQGIIGRNDRARSLLEGLVARFSDSRAEEIRTLRHSGEQQIYWREIGWEKHGWAIKEAVVVLYDRGELARADVLLTEQLSLLRRVMALPYEASLDRTQVTGGCLAALATLAQATSDSQTAEDLYAAASAHLTGADKSLCYRAIAELALRDSRPDAAQHWIAAGSSPPLPHQAQVRLSLLRSLLALQTDDLDNARRQLQDALHTTRAASMIPFEVDVLISLGRLYRLAGDLEQAHAVLVTAHERASAVALRLSLSEACCCLAEVYRDKDDSVAALQHARQAYDLAWCDGPPLIYRYGLDAAHAVLLESGADAPHDKPYPPTTESPSALRVAMEMRLWRPGEAARLAEQLAEREDRRSD